MSGTAGKLMAGPFTGLTSDNDDTDFGGRGAEVKELIALAELRGQLQARSDYVVIFQVVRKQQAESQLAIDDAKAEVKKKVWKQAEARFEDQLEKQKCDFLSAIETTRIEAEREAWEKAGVRNQELLDRQQANFVSATEIVRQEAELGVWERAEAQYSEWWAERKEKIQEKKRAVAEETESRVRKEVEELWRNRMVEREAEFREKEVALNVEAELRTKREEEAIWGRRMETKEAQWKAEADRLLAVAVSQSRADTEAIWRLKKETREAELQSAIDEAKSRAKLEADLLLQEQFKAKEAEWQAWTKELVEEAEGQARSQVAAEWQIRVAAIEQERGVVHEKGASQVPETLSAWRGLCALDESHANVESEPLQRSVLDARKIERDAQVKLACEDAVTRTKCAMQVVYMKELEVREAEWRDRADTAAAEAKSQDQLAHEKALQRAVEAKDDEGRSKMDTLCEGAALQAQTEIRGTLLKQLKAWETQCQALTKQAAVSRKAMDLKEMQLKENLDAVCKDAVSQARIEAEAKWEKRLEEKENEWKAGAIADAKEAGRRNDDIEAGYASKDFLQKALEAKEAEWKAKAAALCHDAALQAKEQAMQEAVERDSVWRNRMISSLQKVKDEVEQFEKEKAEVIQQALSAQEAEWKVKVGERCREEAACARLEAEAAFAKHLEASEGKWEARAKALAKEARRQAELQSAELWMTSMKEKERESNDNVDSLCSEAAAAAEKNAKADLQRRLAANELEWEAKMRGVCAEAASRTRAKMEADFQKQIDAKDAEWETQIKALVRQTKRQSELESDEVLKQRDAKWKAEVDLLRSEFERARAEAEKISNIKLEVKTAEWENRIRECEESAAANESIWCTRVKELKREQKMIEEDCRTHIASLTAEFNGMVQAQAVQLLQQRGPAWNLEREALLKSGVSASLGLVGQSLHEAPERSATPRRVWGAEDFAFQNSCGGVSVVRKAAIATAALGAQADLAAAVPEAKIKTAAGAAVSSVGALRKKSETCKDADVSPAGKGTAAALRMGTVLKTMLEAASILEATPSSQAASSLVDGGPNVMTSSARHESAPSQSAEGKGPLPMHGNQGSALFTDGQSRIERLRSRKGNALDGMVSKKRLRWEKAQGGGVVDTKTSPGGAKGVQRQRTGEGGGWC
eukprot:TRINITY_DN3842_c0_g1_i1.p1 TRINITY_DN3842_c0_g1~~TRINITY_DN3842_c0_g1_i1.p1  ORF type:complete len:1155 (-),score=256.71 TRINITY_DN3842_c0_g1_i1:1024-4488(-)